MKGPIDTLPEVSGLMVYKSGHVGVYEGGGYVIESKSFDKGTVRSALKDTAWTHWLAVPWISYAGYEDALAEDPFAGPYEALVTTSKTPLNIWNNTRKGKSLLQVPKGGTLTVPGTRAIRGG